MQNLITTPAPAQEYQPASTPATNTLTNQKAERVRILMRRAFLLADDESRERLSWADRDQIARDLHEAMCLLHELHPQAVHTH